MRQSVDAARGSRRAVVLLVLLGLLGLGPHAAASTSSELEACFLDRINQVREVAGMRHLSVASHLVVWGRDHSQQMAERGRLFHSAVEELLGYLPDGWQSGGENVGYATASSTCDLLFQGFWRSSEHRRRMLTPEYNYVGIGVFLDERRALWTTHVFVEAVPAALLRLDP